MEITKKAKFTTDFYGGKGYLSGSERVKKWLGSQQDRLLHPRFKALKDAIGNETKLEDILSVFNADPDGQPVIGDWMLLQCSINAQKLANTWGKHQVSADRWRDSALFLPTLVHLGNGKPIKRPDGVEIYNVVPKGKSGFFKAYQYINAGAEFEFTVTVPDDLCEKVEGRGKNKIFVADPEKTEICVNDILGKMCMIGIGAYRLRFGKFKYI